MAVRASPRKRQLPTSEKPDTNVSYQSKRASSTHGDFSIQKKCILITGFLVVVTFIIGFAHNLMYEHYYAIVIDAGSTGSRLNAFNFKKSLLSGNYELAQDLFVEVNPGLSSYEDPKEGAKTVLELLSHSKLQTVIPPTEWAKTPLTVKATAGLRLLPEKQAQAILDEVQKVISELPFPTNDHSVGIMDGVDEGIFLWFTINFLTNSLGGRIEDTSGTLDLGGGSTQVTFAIVPNSPLWKTSKEYLHPVSAFHQNLTVYTHSYLGLGLMAARMGVLSKTSAEGTTILQSPCMHPIISADWAYNRVVYTVKGIENASDPSNPVHAKEARCFDLIHSYIKGKVDSPEELKVHSRINAVSYYFDRATEYGLIDPFESGRIQVKSYKEAAKYSCAQPNADQPFMCFDMLYIYSLLTEGFGLKPDTYLDVSKKIDGHELSWALGAAFHLLQNGV